jgi:hypothetical protein
LPKIPMAPMFPAVLILSARRVDARLGIGNGGIR